MRRQLLGAARKRRVQSGFLLAGGMLAGAGTLAVCGNNAGLAAATAAVLQQQRCQPGSTRLTIQGYGTAHGVPDQLTVSIGVQTTAPSALAAMSSNARKATALIARLEADGVPERGLQTTNLSVGPVYNNSGTKITGYQVSNTLTVTLDTQGNLKKAGVIIDDAAGAAGNAVRVDGISFSVRDTSTLLAQARTAAVHQAMAQAAALAQASGSSLGPVCSLQDNTQQSQPPPPVGFLSVGHAAPAASTPVAAGTEEVDAAVTMVFQLGQATGAPGPARG